MKPLVFYHSADFDGLFCREIARKFLPDATLIGWNFGDAQFLFPRDREQQVYILDLPVLNGPLCSASGSAYPLQSDTLPKEQIVWLDHHASSIASHPKDMPGYRIDGVAACRLAWQWFNRRVVTPELNYDMGIPTKEAFIERLVSEPLAVRLAGEYDIWDKRDPNAELFQHGLKSVPLTDGIWSELLEPRLLPNLVNQLLEKGESLACAREQEYAEVIQTQGFDAQWEGLTFLACNSHELDIRSHLFAAGIKPHHDALLGFTYSGVSKDWRVSLYHAPGKEQHDLSQIAVKHGGGGHRGACGCRLKTLPFLS